MDKASKLAPAFFATVVDRYGQQVPFAEMVVYLGNGEAVKITADIDGLVHLDKKSLRNWINGESMGG